MAARQRGAAVILIYGAHLLRNGAAQILSTYPMLKTIWKPLPLETLLMGTPVALRNRLAGLARFAKYIVPSFGPLDRADFSQPHVQKFVLRRAPPDANIDFNDPQVIAQQEEQKKRADDSGYADIEIDNLHREIAMLAPKAAPRMTKEQDGGLSLEVASGESIKTISLRYLYNGRIVLYPTGDAKAPKLTKIKLVFERTNPFGKEYKREKREVLNSTPLFFDNPEQKEGAARVEPKVDRNDDMVLTYYESEFDARGQETFKEKESDGTALLASQRGTWLKSAFTKDNPNGLPQMVKGFNKEGKEVWDDAEQMRFFEQLAASLNAKLHRLHGTPYRLQERPAMAPAAVPESNPFPLSEGPEDKLPF